MKVSDQFDHQTNDQDNLTKVSNSGKDLRVRSVADQTCVLIITARLVVFH